MVLTAYSRLSPAIGLFVTVIPEKRQLLKNLTPASRRQDHMASPSASVLFVTGSFASTASCTHVRDDRETPLLVAQDGRETAGDFRTGSSERRCDRLARRANQFLRATGPVKKVKTAPHGQRLVHLQTPARRQRTKRLSQVAGGQTHPADRGVTPSNNENCPGQCPGQFANWISINNGRRPGRQSHRSDS